MSVFLNRIKQSFILELKNPISVCKFSSSAKPPSAPYHLRTRAESGKIYLQWTKPLERSQYITGYLIKYSVMPTATQVTVFTSEDSTATTIRTNENSGRLFMLRVAASSEGGWSNFSKPHYARACTHISVK